MVGEQEDEDLSVGHHDSAPTAGGKTMVRLMVVMGVIWLTGGERSGWEGVAWRGSLEEENKAIGKGWRWHQSIKN
jgi:hypothetical protein